MIQATVKCAGYLKKRNYFVSYLSYTRPNLKYNKAIHIAWIDNSLPNAERLAHLHTTIATILAQGIPVAEIPVKEVKSEVKTWVGVALSMLGNLDEFKETKIYQIANNKETLENAFNLLSDPTLPYITPAEARILNKAECGVTTSNFAVNYRKGSQLMVIEVLSPIKVKCECSCGCIICMPVRMLGMVLRCRKCEPATFDSAFKVMTTVDEYVRLKNKQNSKSK